ncbi:geranyl diphosphate 2-C-methyltransferase [Nocardia sp. NPDC052112]|uniref:geranyl diphosphate 2-C-methyltransferase n=1 Tax=Nocardia sp. NPDC052112 TaxID=3155646 RepID=UPI00342BA74E
MLEETVMNTTPANSVFDDAYQRQVADWWNNRRNDAVNLALGDIDKFYHHHCGVGAIDEAVLAEPPETREQSIIAELHRLETAQANYLLDHLGPLTRADRVLDAGSGRGGLSFMANLRFGCRVDGVSISQYQVDFATEQAAERGVADQVHFWFRNMLHTEFEDQSMQAIWNNESTMYVDLDDLFRELSRLLRPGGRYVCITGCYNDILGPKSSEMAYIDGHYHCDFHSRSDYFRAMAANNLTPIKVIDLSLEMIPYWELRAKSSVATGIESHFLSSLRDRTAQYLLIVADRV